MVCAQVSKPMAGNPKPYLSNWDGAEPTSNINTFFYRPTYHQEPQEFLIGNSIGLITTVWDYYSKVSD